MERRIFSSLFNTKLVQESIDKNAFFESNISKCFHTTRLDLR